MEDQNQRPVETSNIPTITLAVLVLLILSLLYVGYGYFSDGPDVQKFVDKNATENKAEAQISEPELSKTENNDTKIAEKSAKEKEKEEKPKEIEKVDEEKVEKEKPKETKVAEIPDGGVTIPHLVQSGETFFGIANRYNLKSDALKALNPDVDPQKLQIGTTKLKVKIKAKHTVGPGDILSVVAKKYGISKKLLMDANKLDKDFSKRGDVLLIPLK
jgi:LysM repeat protein